MNEKKETRVNQIIEAAIDEFIEKGYDGSSMEGIARRAGLSKGGLYHHFKSKMEILFTVNMKFMEPVQGMMNDIESNKSLVEGLKQYIHDYLDYWNNHRRELNLYFLTMNESFGNQQLMELYKRSTRGMFEYFGNLFQKGQESGIFRPCDAYERAVSMISCLDGYLGYMLIDPELQPDKTEKEIQKIFLEDLLK